MPGEFPSAGHENPYRTSNLDPRVDGGRRVDPSSTGTQNRDSGLNSGTTGRTGGDPGVASVDASHTANQPYPHPEPSGLAGHSSSSSTHPTAPVPSGLTTNADSTSRSAEYGTSAGMQVADSSATTSATGTHYGDNQQDQSYGSQILGGLTGAATTAAGYLGIGNNTETDEPRDTSAISTQPGRTSQETGPPEHYRRESIPTTAYPAEVSRGSSVSVLFPMPR